MFLGGIDFELWLTVAAATATSPVARGVSNAPPPTLRPKNLRLGHCFAYNSISGCNFPNCKLAHTCQKCMGAGHGATRCRSARQLRWTSPNATISRTPPARVPLTNEASTKASSYTLARRTPLSSNLKPLQSSSAANQAHSFCPSNTH